MKEKPSTCKGCPLYRDGYGWVPDATNKRARVLVIGMFPSTYEARQGKPRVGMSIDQYRDQYEKYAGPEPFSYAHVVRCRGQRGTKLPTGKALKEGVQFCRQYDVVPDSTELVMFQGIDVAKHLRPDVKGAEYWRGFILPDKEE